MKSVTQDLKEDLLTVYDPSDAFAMMSLANLKAIKLAIPASKMKTHYMRAFVCRDYPGIAMSQNSIGSLLQRIGMDGSRRRQFYQHRVATAADYHIAIDGTLKQDNSKVNDLSTYSRKTRVRGCSEVSVLYAYGIERMESICAEVFPGNNIDASSYPAFIRDNDIRKGIIVADKGFPSSKIKAELSEWSDLHFLTSIKRNDIHVKGNGMLSFESVF